MNQQDTIKYPDFLYFGKLAGFQVPRNPEPAGLFNERQTAMSIPENDKIIERHGCILCARSFNVLVVYTPDGSMIDCAVTDPGGHCVPNTEHPLVACDIHTEVEIEAAYYRWQSRIDEKVYEANE